MRVDEHDDGRAADVQAAQAGADEALPAAVADEQHAGQQVDVAGERLLQPVVLAAVVDEDDLVEERPGRTAEDAVYGAQQGRQSLVVERDDDGDARHRADVVRRAAAGGRSRVGDVPVDGHRIAASHVELVRRVGDVMPLLPQQQVGARVGEQHGAAHGQPPVGGPVHHRARARPHTRLPASLGDRLDEHIGSGQAQAAREVEARETGTDGEADEDDAQAACEVGPADTAISV